MKMSGGSKKQFKKFEISNKEDACLVLAALISDVSVNLEKYKEYEKEAEDLLSKTDEESIAAKDYDDIKDRLLFRQREILKFVADHQDESFSYKHVRKILKKDEYLVSELSADINKILSDLLDLRNLTFHNAQSRMVAMREVAEKSIPEEMKEICHIKPQLNPVIIYNVTNYETIELASLIIYTLKQIERFEKILEKMKEDYQELYESIENHQYMMSDQGLSNKVQYINRNITAEFSGDRTKVSQISMAIQKSKYDGTNESFKKLALSFNSEKSDKE